MGSSEPHFHGSSRVRDHPSHTTVTLCPWFSGCDGKGVHCPGRGTHLGSTTLSCFRKSPCGASCNPSWCMGHTAWHCPMPHTFGNKPQNLPQPHGDNRLPPLCSPGCSPREQEARDTQWGAELETRAPPNPHASTPLHLLLGPAKEALPPATGPPGALSVSQRPRKGCKTVPNSVPVG